MQLSPLAEPQPAKKTFEQRVSEELRRFDIKPLLRLLEAKGYPRQQVVFQSNASDKSSGSLLQAIEFPRKPGRPVVITVNLGLLGATGLLPSYFLEVVERSDHAERFHEFIRFFDNRLINEYVDALHPESEPALHPDYGRVLQHYLGMLGMHSVATLQWLVQMYIPELSVRVRRAEFPESTAQHAFRTGSTPIDGSGILGQHYQFVRAGFEVEAYAEDFLNDTQRAWPEVIGERLYSRILPVLHAHHIPLRFVLHILHHSSWLTLSRDPVLGYERVVPERDAMAKERGKRREYAHSILLYQGSTGDARHTLRWCFRRYFPDFPLRVSQTDPTWATLDDPTPSPCGFVVEVFVDLGTHPARHFLEALGRPLGLMDERRIPTLTELRQELGDRLGRDVGGHRMRVTLVAKVRPEMRGDIARDSRVQAITLYEGVPGH